MTEHGIDATPLATGAEPTIADRLSALRIRIDRIGRSDRRADQGVSLDCPAIESALPNGRLPTGCLHAVEGDSAAAAGFAAWLAGRIAETRPIVWVLLRLDIYPQGLADFGLSPDRLLIVRARKRDEALWAMEEALRCPAVGCVIGETATDMTASRRLQLAAEAGATTALLLTTGNGTGAEAPGSAKKGNKGLTVAVTRWLITPAPTEANEPGLGPVRWHAALERCRGGRPGSWTLELAKGTDATQPHLVAIMDAAITDTVTTTSPSRAARLETERPASAGLRSA